MKKAESNALWWFTVLFLAGMFLPRLVTQGMFGDGLLYSSLARNLAEGKGSMWAPFFSSGYWIDFASGNPYFENPPLMIWLQAGFFRLLGDPWWVEKLYALLLFILNAWLMVRIWEIPLRGTVFQGKYGWFPLLFWYLIPSVIWGNPNNLMDNNLLTFCLLSLWCALDGLFSGKRIWTKWILSGLCVYLGFMTKGPVALYPVAAPFLFAVIGLTTLSYLTGDAALPPSLSREGPGMGRMGSLNRTFYTKQLIEGSLRSFWIGITAVGLFALMLALIPEARIYFENYWEKRLGVVLSGVREDAALTGWARLSIFAILAKELAGVTVLFFVLLFVSRKKKFAETVMVANRRFTHTPKTISLLFLLLGFAATLPLVFSARQSGMYIIPSLPMFALAAGYYHLPLLYHWFAEPSEKTMRLLRNLRGWSAVAMFILMGHILFRFGRPGREKILLHDLPYIQQAIPKGEKVAVCEKLMRDLHAHAYLQRFHHLELTRDWSATRYALTDRVCDAEMQGMLDKNGFAKMDSGLTLDSYFQVYIKR